jgi:hypothetical protein
VAEAWEIFDSEVLLEPSDDRQGVLARLLERWLSFYEREVFAGGCRSSSQPWSWQIAKTWYRTPSRTS